ncbi:MAG: 4-hydroxy-tetrahydrodipicolinate synthase [Candidatus Krumholzibacteriia bacterium]
MEFAGTYTALVTPFKGGELDLGAYKRLLAAQRDAAVVGVVPCGCTGEAATLTEAERMTLLHTTLEEVGGDMQVMAGTGTNATESTIRITREAQAAGVHAAMLITPYYNKPSQAGLLDHYRRVADATTLPLVLYNVPGRTGVTLAPDTIARLYETGRYAAVKEAGGSIDAVSDIRESSDIPVLSGDDSLTVAMLALGARGVVSVVSNLLPQAVRDMVAAALDGDFSRACKWHFRLLPVMRAAFVESNPSPIKTMLASREFMSEEVRAPLAVVGREGRERIQAALERFGASGSE